MRSIFSQRMASESPDGGRVPRVSLVPAGELAAPAATAPRSPTPSPTRPRRVRLAARRPATGSSPGALALVPPGWRRPRRTSCCRADKGANRKLLERVAAEPGPAGGAPARGRPRAAAATTSWSAATLLGRRRGRRARAPRGARCWPRRRSTRCPATVLRARSGRARRPRPRSPPTSGRPGRPPARPAQARRAPRPCATCSPCSSRRRRTGTTRSSTASRRSSTRHGSGGERGRRRPGAREPARPRPARAPTAPSARGRPHPARRPPPRAPDAHARDEAPAHGAPPPRLPRRAQAPDGRAARRLRRVLVPRLLLQPARDLREGARARAGDPRRLGRQARARGDAVPAGRRGRRRRHAGVLRRDRAGDVLRQQRQLPQPPRQARRAPCTCRPTTARR